jgi:hypothetical protein
MSGASALTAAKRRRAVPTDPPNSNRIKTPTEVPRIQNPKTPNPTSIQPVQPPAQNPLQLLLQHEQKINELQNSLSQVKLDKSNPITPDTLEYFKKQHELMNREINELKKVLIKVQTFSMETNLELLKMKKLIKTHEPTETTVETRVPDTTVDHPEGIPFLSSSNEFNSLHENVL